MSNTDETRLFFVTDGTEDDEEIFETLERAEAYYRTLDNKPRLYIAVVRNAYQEGDDDWNYDDFSNTFEIIKFIKGGDNENL